MRSCSADKSKTWGSSNAPHAGSDARLTTSWPRRCKAEPMRLGERLASSSSRTSAIGQGNEGEQDTDVSKRTPVLGDRVIDFVGVGVPVCDGQTDLSERELRNSHQRFR